MGRHPLAVPLLTIQVWAQAALVAFGQSPALRPDTEEARQRSAIPTAPTRAAG
jgi:hypothetical protein